MSNVVLVWRYSWPDIATLRLLFRTNGAIDLMRPWSRMSKVVVCMLLPTGCFRQIATDMLFAASCCRRYLGFGGFEL